MAVNRHERIFFCTGGYKRWNILLVKEISVCMETWKSLSQAKCFIFYTFLYIWKGIKSIDFAKITHRRFRNKPVRTSRKNFYSRSSEAIYGRIQGRTDLGIHRHQDDLRGLMNAFEIQDPRARKMHNDKPGYNIGYSIGHSIG